jgi:GDP-4-dehydro-6-deoxy-D-mannose reductase
MRCLITGATGFVGRHLAAALRAAGHECVGLARDPGPLDIPVHPADLTDGTATEAVLRDVRPGWVFHLAGYANPAESKKHPALAWTGNVTATVGLYEAILHTGLHPRILFVSTGLVYGDAGPGETVFSESDSLRPDTPYAASKAAADLISSYEARCSGLEIVRVRPFNQIGPGQSAGYAVGRFASEIVAVERGVKRHVEVRGDLNGRRDLTDVRDMVRAYVRLLEVGRPGEVYNAGSGRTYRMQEILDRLVALAGVPVKVEERTDASRTADVAVTRADIRKLREATGWEPAYTLEQTLADVLTDWRGRYEEEDRPGRAEGGR